MMLLSLGEFLWSLHVLFFMVIYFMMLFYVIVDVIPTSRCVWRQEALWLAVSPGRPADRIARLYDHEL